MNITKTKLISILTAFLALFSVNSLCALDFGDHSSSTITTKAWNAYSAQNYADAIAYSNKCIEMYKTQALEQQASLTAKAPKNTASEYWALNDVGTCYFIMAQSYEAQGNKEQALAAYKTLTTSLSFSQCWDNNGWFWGPADAAKKKVEMLEFDI